MDKPKKEIAEIIKKIEQTTEAFYQQRNEEGYKNLESLLNSMSVLFKQISTYKSEGIELDIDEARLNNILNDAMNALERADNILLSDILKYELEGLLEAFLERL
jgi:hypothetical protein